MSNVTQIAVTQGISFPPALLEAAKVKAAADRRSLSSYIQILVERDTAEADAPRAVNFARRGRNRRPEAAIGGKKS